MTIKSEMEAFFRSYIESFIGRDADAIAEHWDLVGLFPSPNGNFSMEREAFRKHCATLLDFYRQQGVVKPTGELLSADELFPNVVQARVAYRMLGENDAVIVQWEHVYILRKSDAWRISLTIADDELAAWTALGAQL